MVCSSRYGTRQVQSGFSNFGEFDVFGRNLRDRFCTRSHTSHDGKLGIKVGDDVAAFGMISQNNCQDYTVHPMGLTNIIFSIIFGWTDGRTDDRRQTETMKLVPTGLLLLPTLTRMLPFQVESCWKATTSPWSNRWRATRPAQPRRSHLISSCHCVPLCRVAMHHQSRLGPSFDGDLATTVNCTRQLHPREELRSVQFILRGASALCRVIFRHGHGSSNKWSQPWTEEYAFFRSSFGCFFVCQQHGRC